jgi:pyruvate dehydrogenase E2 component (dihydrolipoamide acetyltransferase)
MSIEIKLPELGEGIENGIVAAVLVKKGDAVEANDPIIEIETDKAVLPVPVSDSGTIVDVKVTVGETLDVGGVIAVMEGGAVETTKPEVKEEAKTEAANESTEEAEDVVEEVAPAQSASGPVSDIEVFLPALGEGIESGLVAGVLVEVGDQIDEGNALIELETDKAVLPVPTPIPGKVSKLNIAVGDTIEVGGLIANIEASAAKESVQPEPNKAPIKQSAEPKSEAKINAPAAKMSPSQPVKNSGKVVSAGPATRKFARELGVDLSLVTGSKRGGRIDIDDVKKYVKEQNAVGAKAQSGGFGFAPINLPDFTKYGDVKVEPATNLRKIISERMSRNWSTIPHVYQFQEIDISEISSVAKEHGAEFKEKGSSASPTNFFIKAMSMCLKEFPIFNSSFDPVKGDIHMKSYYNIGVAVDTPSGLIVPVLKGVDKMSIFDIGKNLKELAKNTRERKVVPDDLAGGCMTLTNLGGIGGTHFTPIINSPEVAILGLGRAQVKPIFIDGEFKPRTIATATLAYDHRVIDGADGARFVQHLKNIMENFNKYLLGVTS